MLNFPNSPSIDQIHESGTKQWQWNGSAWISLDLTEPSAPVFEFETGDIVESTAATYTAPDWLPCDESCGEALGIENAATLTPSLLRDVLKWRYSAFTLSDNIMKQ